MLLSNALSNLETTLLTLCVFIMHDEKKEEKKGDEYSDEYSEMVPPENGDGYPQNLRRRGIRSIYGYPAYRPAPP